MHDLFLFRRLKELNQILIWLVPSVASIFFSHRWQAGRHTLYIQRTQKSISRQFSAIHLHYHFVRTISRFYDGLANVMESAAIWHIINFLGDLWPGREVICSTTFFRFWIMYGLYVLRAAFSMNVHLFVCSCSPSISAHFINISCIFVWVNTAHRTFLLSPNKFVYAFHDNDHRFTFELHLIYCRSTRIARMLPSNFKHLYQDFDFNGLNVLLNKWFTKKNAVIHWFAENLIFCFHSEKLTSFVLPSIAIQNACQS